MQSSSTSKSRTEGRNNKMEKVLVTGGAGFVGHHLVKRFLQMGWTVHVLDDLSNGTRSDVPSGAVFFEGDVRDADAVGKAMNDCQAVVHLAARVELQKSIIDPADCFSVNVTGTANVVAECLKMNDRRLVFASSCAVYPLNPGKPLTEDMATSGETPYALSKRSGEQIINIYNRMKGLNACSLRCFNIYGPKQRADSPYAAVVPKFIDLSLHGKPLTIYGSGEQTRDFVHVEDVVDCYIVAADSNAGGTFNVGTGEATSIKKLAEEVIKIEGAGEIMNLPAVPGDASSSRADISLTRATFNYSPKISLSRGLRSLYFAVKRRAGQD